ncbi:MAG: hypothetical protein JO320_18935 [Alphaproteobacteria bacterium]|nr:hypothetical protein [Alphaproteobacteria bacterium]
MNKALLISAALAGLAVTGALQGVAAAPLALPDSPMIFSPNGHSRAFEEIYYFHGRNYPYGYNNRYYTHRAYRNGHWHYY